ncbi:unnamed protein product, partial [Symbiodinium necroappetens]
MSRGSYPSARDFEALWAEVSSLRSEVLRLQARVAELEDLNQGFALVDSSEAAGASSSIASARDPSASAALPSTAASAPPSDRDRVVICKRVGEFLRRALDGGHRGASGRDSLELASRHWVVIRDFQGRVHSPPLVFSRFSDCKALVKRGQDVGDSVFIGLPSKGDIKVALQEGEEDGVDGRTLYLYDGETADCDFEVGVLRVLVAEGSPEVLVEVILICELEGRSLVAVPQGGWHRRATNRSLPPGSLSKPVAVEVAGAARDDRQTVLGNQRLKVWLGFLRDSLVEALVFEHDGEVDVAFTTLGGGSGFVPHAEALMEVAKDKFQFATATEGEAPAIPAPQPQAAETSMESRLAKLEQSIATIASSMQALSLDRVERAKPPAPPRPPQAVEGLPGLDPGVVKSALTAGIDMESLKQFSQLLAGNPARRLKDPGAGMVPKKATLDESENEGAADDPEEAVPEAELRTALSRDPMSDALVKLTTLVEDLQTQKTKRGSRLEQALEGAAAGSGSQDGGGDLEQKELLGSPCLEASTSREPRGDLHHHREVDAGGSSFPHAGPWDAKADIVCKGLAGKQKPAYQLSGGCENCLGVAGILDCLINSNPAEARARATLMLLQADQVALDKGSWTLAAEASLERYVNLAVAAMNWLFLSRPRCAPAGLAAGNPLSKRQWEMVKLLERCLDGCDFLTFEPPDLGRTASKLEDQDQILGWGGPDGPASGGLVKDFGVKYHGYAGQQVGSSAEAGRIRTSKEIASSLTEEVAGIYLPRDCGILCSGRDLKDFFYQFKDDVDVIFGKGEVKVN